MNIAVSEGADEGAGFKYYVKYLADEGHIPPKATAWVDHIRDRGNDANHEITIMGREDVERLIRFSEMLLRIMYEYPSRDPLRSSRSVSCQLFRIHKEVSRAKLGGLGPWQFFCSLNL